MQDVIISESKLEDFIYNHLSGLKHIEHIDEFFESNDILFVERQFNLGDYGVADIVCFYNTSIEYDIRVEIYELKKGIIDKSALIQALRYKAGISFFLTELGFSNFEISVILVGSDVSHDDKFNFMPSAIENLSIYSYDICAYNGLIIKDENSWHFSDIQIPENIKNKSVCISYSKHDFNCCLYHFQKNYK